MTERIYQASGALSALFSGSVVLTGLIFPGLLTDSRKVFSNILFYISLTDFFASLSYCFGFPSNGTVFCTLQGFLFDFFAPASWIWTTLLVYQLQTAIIYRRLWMKLWHMHAITWMTSALIAFLPLATLREYGIDDVYNGKSLCTYSGRNLEKFLWLMFYFNAFLFICIIIMSACVVSVVLHLRKINAGDVSDNSKTVLLSMRLYPLEMIIAWLPIVLVNIFVHFNTTSPSRNDKLNEICLILASQYGTALAITYYTQTQEARQQWARFFGCRREAVDNILFLSSVASEAEIAAVQYFDRESLGLQDRLVDRSIVIQE